MIHHLLTSKNPYKSTVPTTPEPTSSILASHNFNDSTFGPYYNSGESRISIIDDSTGSGRNKLVKIDYTTDDGETNAWIGIDSLTALGESIFFKGDFYLQPEINMTPSFAQRKLLYYQRADSGIFPQFWSIVTMFGGEIKALNGCVQQNGSVLDFTEWRGVLTTVNAGTWYTLETEVKLNSAFGVQDGLFRIWLDNVLLLEELNIRYSDPAWLGVLPSQQKFLTYLVGDQLNGAPGSSISEYRLWDNVAFSKTGRLP